MIRLLCALHVVMIFPFAAQAASAVAPSHCAELVESVDARPDLGSVRIFLKKELQKKLVRRRYSPEWIGAAVRRSLREAHPVEPGKLRFVLFLAEPRDLQPVARVEFDWYPSQNGIQIFHASEFRSTLDGALYKKIQNTTPLRNFPVKASLFDFALNVAIDNGIEVVDVASALEHPMGPPVENRTYEGQLWVLGRGTHDQLVSINYLPVDETGLMRIKAVTPVSTDRKRTYFSQYGCTTEHTQEPLAISSGRYRYKKVCFGPGLVAKVENQHGTTRAEVIEAFEKSRGGVPCDSRCRQTAERRWFVSRLESGDMVKVAYACSKNGDVTILTAYHTDLEMLKCYARLAAQFSP